MTERIAVLGTGLIGTSIALAARRGLDASVSGFDPNPEAIEGARRLGAVEPASSVEAAAEGAAIVFVCAPLSAIGSVVAEALQRSDAVVTDVGSAKSGVLQAIRGTAGRERFVGGHPMTGSERSGPEAASAALLDGAVWVLTPSEESRPDAVDRVEDAVRQMGALPVRMTAERHDRMVAFVSHLPQLVSAALMRTAASGEDADPLLLAAGGFRDLTRLASSSPELWADIVLANREELAEAIDRFTDELRELGALVSTGDAARLVAAFEEAKRARLSLGAKPTTRLGVAILGVPIPDRPGALAEITAGLGDRAVNIEDLEIVHAVEGGRGNVHLTVGREDVDAAVEILEGRGYRVVRLA